MKKGASLLHNVGKEMEYKVHYIRDSSVYTVGLTDQTLTLKEAII